MKSPLLLSLFLLAVAAGCESTGDKGTEDSADQMSPQEMEVTVQGADATVEDSTIKLEYPQEDDINHRVPDWVINPALGGVTGAVGAARANDLGVRDQLDQARLNGRLELASMLELRVQRVGRSELEQDERVEQGEDVSSSRRETLSIDRQILDMVLAGTRQRALWWDTETGEVYVWMVVDGAILDRVDQAVARGVSVFTAKAKIASEYLPDREQPPPPTVIVQMPETQAAPAPEPEAPPPPMTPIEELEENLKPIETIPVSEEDETPSEGGGGGA